MNKTNNTKHTLKKTHVIQKKKKKKTKKQPTKTVKEKKHTYHVKIIWN